ncbi:hypothetical protein A6R68_03424, partial [Neotoma lepida]
TRAPLLTTGLQESAKGTKSPKHHFISNCTESGFLQRDKGKQTANASLMCNDLNSSDAARPIHQYGTPLHQNHRGGSLGAAIHKISIISNKKLHHKMTGHVMHAMKQINRGPVK